MTVLERVYFRDNMLEGDLSAFVDNDGTSLTHVDVSRNKLTGMDHLWHNQTGLLELNLVRLQPPFDRFLSDLLSDFWVIWCDPEPILFDRFL